MAREVPKVLECASPLALWNVGAIPKYLWPPRNEAAFDTDSEANPDTERAFRTRPSVAP